MKDSASESGPHNKFGLTMLAGPSKWNLNIDIPSRGSILPIPADRQTERQTHVCPWASLEEMRNETSASASLHQVHFRVVELSWVDSNRLALTTKQHEYIQHRAHLRDKDYKFVCL